MSIKNWKQDDRPREKFFLKGRTAVSDSELLAILIGGGNKGKSALDLARDILAMNADSLEKLGKLSVKELMKFKGIGEAKAVTIAAALELGNRKSGIENTVSERMNSSANAFHMMKAYFAGLKHEEFYVAYLNKNLTLIRIEKLAMGGTSMALIDIKILAKTALDYLASSIVVAHNHPSGVLLPSVEDDRLTGKLKEALAFFDMTLSDHLIIHENAYYSYADKRRI